MDFLADIVNWLNVPMNALGKFIGLFITNLPGWLSNTIISAIVGVILLIIFKYTSNQKAIEKVRAGIKANMLALKLFKDSMLVTLKSQGGLFKGAFSLLFHAIRPMLIMIIPVSFILGQMGLWYQHRPLKIGEKAIITMQLSDTNKPTLPEVTIQNIPNAKVTTDPVHLLSKNQIWWEIQAVQDGTHYIDFKIDDKIIKKELTIGIGFARLSPVKPQRNFSDMILHPKEKPFGKDSLVQSISITYPDRDSFTCGTNWWIAYFFIASMIFAFIFKPLLKVKI